MTTPIKTRITVDIDGEKTSVMPLGLEWNGACWILRGWETGKDEPARAFVIKEVSVNATEDSHGRCVEQDP
jgi:hypothetical protein